jgi:uncharacterized protein with von Willebrand factor type A (vWA) domain
LIKNKFHKFIHFGGIGDRAKRSQLAFAIYDGLRLNSAVRFSNRDTDNFGTAVSRILEDKTLRETCAENPELAEQITQEILDFINAAKQDVLNAECPFDTERQLLEEFERINPEEFENAWEAVAPFIQETYTRDDVDTDFYGEAFRKSLIPRKRRSRKKVSFDGVKAHFTERWRALFERKQDDWEENYIEERRKPFSGNLRRRLEEMQAMEELLPGNPMRRWNLTKTQLQQANFNVFNKYAEFLRRDPLIQELADLLGRSQQADIEFEEVQAEDSETEPEWLASYASKSEIIGVHESDDLSSVLPSETVLLAEETAQFLFYKKFAEKKLQTFEYRGIASVFRTDGTRRAGWRRRETPKGPFILCIDTSGSMRGAAETVAKTLCFALLKTALQEKRACYLISFAVGLETLNLADLENALDGVIAFLSQSFYGGTDPMPVFHEALNMLETEAYRTADLIMVSDFFMPPLDDLTLARIREAKKNKTRFHSLLIGDQRDTAVNRILLQDFDTNWSYDVDYYDT